MMLPTSTKPSSINLLRQSSLYSELFRTPLPTFVFGLFHWLTLSSHSYSCKKFWLYRGTSSDLAHQLEHLLLVRLWSGIPSWRSPSQSCWWWTCSNASSTRCVFTGLNSKTSSSRVLGTSTRHSLSPLCSRRRWPETDKSFQYSSIF